MTWLRSALWLLLALVVFGAVLRTRHSPNRQRAPPELELEARGGIEPPIKVLQTLAFPLGYRANLLIDI
jgi:hypothetical protein